MRKRPLILSLILLILIGGGGVAFHLHLQKLAPPTKSDWLRLISSTKVAGWHVEPVPGHSSQVREKTGWWTSFGYRRTVVWREERYIFTHPSKGDPTVMTLETEGEKITGLTLSGDGFFEEDFFGAHREYQQFHYSILLCPL